MREHPISIVFSNLYGEETWDEDGAPVSDEQVNIAGPIADEFKTNNPGLFKTQVWEHGLRVVGEISVVTDYIYRLREAGLGDYIQLWGSNEWLESYGSNFPDPRRPIEHIFYVYKYEVEDPTWKSMESISTCISMTEASEGPVSDFRNEITSWYEDGEEAECTVTLSATNKWFEAFKANWNTIRPDTPIEHYEERMPLPPQPIPPAKPWVAIRIPIMGGDSGPCSRVAETIRREASDRGHTYDMPDTYYTEQMDDGTGFLMETARWYAFRCSEPAYYDVIRSKSQTSWYEYLEVEVFEVPDGYNVFSVEYYQGYGNKNLAWIENGVQTIAAHVDSVATKLRVLANGMDWTVPANIVYTINQAAADEITSKAYEQYIEMPEEAYYRCKTILPTPNPV